MKRVLPIICLGALSLATQAYGQQGHGGATSGATSTTSAIALPAECRELAEASGSRKPEMGTGASADAPPMMGQMTETQKGLHQAMMRMSPAMMEGMMAKDADVAWVCAMIPHHQGAIDMARAGLRGADNPESKRLAKKTIEENERSVKELIQWLDKHARLESRNETGASQPK